MRARILLWILSVVFAGEAAAAGLERQSFRQDGLARQYFVYQPEAAAPSGGRPVILVLHGGGGRARSMIRLAGAGFHAFAERTGAVVVYPEAIEGTWDFGEGAVSERLSPRRDDLAYFRTVLRRVMAAHGGDASRVFATGISRGGQASYFLACKMGGIRAIAAVAMPLPDFLADDCRAGPPVPVAILNGTADPLVPYDGGPITIGRAERGQVLSTVETARLFAARNRCGQASQSLRIGAVTRQEWSRCRAAVVVYRIEGGGHTWPGGRQFLPRRLVGPVNRDIDATAEILEFFRRHF